jgi:hypothetical protein
MSVGESGMEISRLGPSDAEQVVDCFHRVYGESYANELFYDPIGLGKAMAAGRIGCVGAKDENGRVIAHMALSVRPGASVVEQGNTVVDPAARGQGLAWKVGAELSAWSQELGFRGFLHYPTTDHHIMQRQSVKAGYETGLMLGYIPAETDGHVRDAASTLREAATIVYQPFRPGEKATCYLPTYCKDEITSFAEVTGLPRVWRFGGGTLPVISTFTIEGMARRGLCRLVVQSVGSDLRARIRELEDRKVPCRQIDLLMSDAGIEAGVEAAREAGFWFCGWLPGYRSADVLRMQKVEQDQTNMAPGLVNPVASTLLSLVETAP